jgi:hypothetical protein
MKSLQIRRGELVRVHWLDAYGSMEAWTPDSEALRHGTFKVETVGYCLGVRKGYMVVCGDWADGCKGRVFAVPYGMILRIERVEAEMSAKKKGKKCKGKGK